MSATQLVLSGILLLGLALSSKAQVSLKVGDKAPDLQVKEWIKGSPVNGFEPGKFYLVELTATWCGPCRLLIPHLSDVADKYKGRVEVISVYVLENDPEKPDGLGYIDHVRKFVKAMDDKIRFTVAVDLPDQYVHRKWARPSGLNGVPAGFLIDRNGRIAWLGIISKGIDNVISAALSGQDSVEQLTKKSIRESEAVEAVINKIFAQKQKGDMENAAVKMDSLLAAYPGSAATYFYRKRFELWAGVDDARAYENLRWILDNRGTQDYDWFKLILAFELTKKPDYVMAHEIADRAIAQAPTPYLKAHSMRLKGQIYYHQNNRPAAIECVTNAIETAKKDQPDANALKVFEDMLAWLKK